MAKDYTVRLTDGTIITINDVTSVEKDGSGLRFKDEDGNVIAGFDDGQAKAHWLSTSEVIPPPTVDDEE